jgi:hypothetical protein
MVAGKIGIAMPGKSESGLITNLPPFVCNMNALSSEQRARHQELENHLRLVVHEICELIDGFEFLFQFAEGTYADLAEITPLEHACCPFFSISIRLEPGAKLVWRLSGPEGIKQFIRAEFTNWF